MQIPKRELWIYEGIFFVILFTLLFAIVSARTRGGEASRHAPFPSYPEETWRPHGDL